MASPVKHPRHLFRVSTRIRGGYDGAIMYDVGLQVMETGALVWVQTFSDEKQADRYRDDLEYDLQVLDDDDFRRKWRVPSSV